MTEILVPLANTPLIDPSSGRVTQQWYRYFSLLQQATGGNTNVIIDVDTLSQTPGAEPIIPSGLAEQADSFGSQNAGRIEELAKDIADVAGMMPPRPEGGDVLAALSALTPFAAPPMELGSLQAAANTAYRIAAGGLATLVAGTVTVNTTAAVASANGLYFLNHQVASGTLGTLSVGTITANTSFVINSTSATDASDVSWLILVAIRG